jgi:beta-glucosidase
MKLLKNIFPLFLICTLSLNAQENLPAFKNLNLSFEQRARDLVNRMTLKEKVSQMMFDAKPVKRLDIPAYNWMNECLHGVANMEKFATVFPQSIGMGASWDKECLFRVAMAISDEARAMHHYGYLNKEGRYVGGLTFFSPNINLIRDPRWGRGQESYSEDPYLLSQMGIQFIKGLQGNDPKYLKLVSTAKHYVVHSGPEPERHEFNALTSKRDFWETYMPHFIAAVREAKVQSIMCAYNRYEGESCCGSDYLLDQLLRKRFGFKGYIVSDCGSIRDIYENHKIKNTPEEAAALALKSGVDLNCGDVYERLPKALEENLITEKDIDTAVYRLMLARMKLGMFDPPQIVPYSKIPEAIIDSKEHKELALEVARKSMVLLKNENNILPLAKTVKKIAIIGPNAANETVLYGSYNGIPSNPISVLTGLKNKLPGAEILYSKGCEYVDSPDLLNLFPSYMLYTDSSFLKKGITVEYFNNKELEGTPVVKRVEQFIFLTSEFGVPFAGLKENNFSVMWKGFIDVPETAGYEIIVEAPEKCKVYLNNELVLDRKFSKSSGQLKLEKGKKYFLKIELVADTEEYETTMFLKTNSDDLKKNAIDVARKSDIVIMTMGISPEIEGEEMGIELPGFSGGDRTKIELPKVQEELIKKISELDKPIILVLMGGGSFALTEENKICDAILEAWYPGQSGGTAIADVLLGAYNPGGKLPVTFYKSTEDLTDFKSYNMKGRTYRFFKGSPLYPFGYGLSYTTFSYSNFNIPQSINAGDDLPISVEVKNTGRIAGDEVVQVYVKDVKASVRTPLLSLQGFERIHLGPGESKTIKFNLIPKQLALLNDNMKWMVEPGKFIISVGGGQPGYDLITSEVLSKSVKVVGENYYVSE